MYRIYFTDPKSHTAHAADVSTLEAAIKLCENFRKQGMLFVTMATDYTGMVGEPGAKGAGSEYVPQFVN